MNHFLSRAGTLAVLLLAIGCASSTNDVKTDTTTTPDTATTAAVAEPAPPAEPTPPPAPPNPLLAQWQGPYGGVPPFDQVRIADHDGQILKLILEIAP